MRFSLFLLLLGLAAGVRAAEPKPRAATPDEIKLFKDAIKNTQQDTEHWAYTETTVKKIGLSRKPEGETVVRFDPSKPWAEQYTPVKIEGKAPTEKQRKQYRERGEKRGKSIMRRAEQKAAAEAGPATPPPPPPPPADKRKEKSITADMEHPLVVGDNGDKVIFEVPLIDKGTKIPVDRIEVRAVVDKARREVRQATMRIKESFRVKLVAKVKEGEGTVNFSVIDPQYGPVMTSGSGTFGASFLAMPVNGVFSNTRADWQRVKPYSERLQVKIGPLELLDF